MNTKTVPPTRRGRLAAIALSTLACVPLAHAGLYTVTDLGTLGGNSSAAYGINASGQVVGQARLAGNTVSHAFLYSGGTMIDIGTTLNGDSNAEHQ